MVFNLIVLFFVSSVTSFVVWTFVTDIDEVTFAPGEIVLADKAIRIQHRDGGTIESINIKNGEQVKEGNVVIVFESNAYKLKAEEMRESLGGLKKRHENFKEQLRIRKRLYNKGLNSRIMYLNIQNQLNDTVIEMNRIKREIESLELKIGRSVMRAPVTGIVHRQNFFNQGEVVAPGQTIFDIIPESEEMVAEIKISPDDIGHIKTGQKVTLKFNTYDFSRYGGITETLDELSTATFLDKEGLPYYNARVTIHAQSLKNKKLPILPGMTLSAEIKTGEKTIFEYLFKPIYYLKDRSMTER